MPTSQAIMFEQEALRAAETAIGFPLGPGIAMMAFCGIAQQVAAVWRFVESEIRDHLALDNAVLVAPEPRSALIRAVPPAAKMNRVRFSSANGSLEPNIAHAAVCGGRAREPTGSRPARSWRR